MEHQVGVVPESCRMLLMKLLRIRQIITNDGKTLISEGIDANFVDILNYSAFALIQLAEGKH